MRKIREVLRLRFAQGLSQESIVRSCVLSKGAVHGYLQRAAAANVTWEMAESMSDGELEALLFAGHSKARGGARAAIDFAWIQRELPKAGVTRERLWMEYQAAAKERSEQAYQYSQFCVQYAAWSQQRDVSMRQVHRAGEKAFIDYSGVRPHVVDAQTGESTPVELFVMVLGASNYTFVEATATQRLDDFTGSIVRGMEYFGASPAILVPDQLRSAVSGPDRYDPDINPALLELAQHYQCAVVPARPRRPKDKAKVEGAVLLAQRWILACLRNRTFFSLAELNEAIAELLEQLNARPFQKLEGTRRSAFESIDLPAMKPLPERRYERAHFRQAKVHIDYHVAFEDRFYSVPCALVGQPVEVRATAGVVEIFHGGERVASHMRSYARKGTAVTVEEHRPKNHRDYGKWPPERMIAWGASMGPNVARVVEHLLARYRNPEMGYRPFLALTRDAKKFGTERFDAACGRALAISGTWGPTRRTIYSILERGLEGAELPKDEPEPLLPLHDNIRGPEYFH